MKQKQTATGEPFNLWTEIANRITPMIFQDMIDIAKDNPNLLPLTVFGFFGVGLQTYKIKLTNKEQKVVDTMVARGYKKEEVINGLILNRLHKQVSTEITLVKNNDKLSPEEKKKRIEELKQIYATLKLQLKNGG